MATSLAAAQQSLDAAHRGQHLRVLCPVDAGRVSVPSTWPGLSGLTKMGGYAGIFAAGIAAALVAGPCTTPVFGGTF